MVDDADLPGANAAAQTVLLFLVSRRIGLGSQGYGYLPAGIEGVRAVAWYFRAPNSTAAARR
jgi:hypothetical protein